MERNRLWKGWCTCMDTGTHVHTHTHTNTTHICTHNPLLHVYIHRMVHSPQVYASLDLTDFDRIFSAYQKVSNPFRST